MTELLSSTLLTNCLLIAIALLIFLLYLMADRISNRVIGVNMLADLFLTEKAWKDLWRSIVETREGLDAMESLYLDVLRRFGDEFLEDAPIVLKQYKLPEEKDYPLP